MKKYSIKSYSLTRQTESKCNAKIPKEMEAEINKAIEIYKAVDIIQLQEDNQIEYYDDSNKINFEDWYNDCFSETNLENYIYSEVKYTKEEFIKALEILQDFELLPYCQTSMENDSEFWLLEMDEVKIITIKKENKKTPKM